MECLEISEEVQIHAAFLSKADIRPADAQSVVQRLSDMPITVEVLRLTGIGKTVNALTRKFADHDSVAALATHLVERWKEMYRDQNPRRESSSAAATATLEQREQRKQAARDGDEGFAANVAGPHSSPRVRWFALQSAAYAGARVPVPEIAPVSSAMGAQRIVGAMRNAPSERVRVGILNALWRTPAEHFPDIAAAGGLKVLDKWWKANPEWRSAILACAEKIENVGKDLHDSGLVATFSSALINGSTDKGHMVELVRILEKWSKPPAAAKRGVGAPGSAKVTALAPAKPALPAEPAGGVGAGVLAPRGQSLAADEKTGALPARARRRRRWAAGVLSRVSEKAIVAAPASAVPPQQTPERVAAIARTASTATARAAALAPKTEVAPPAATPRPLTPARTPSVAVPEAARAAAASPAPAGDPRPAAPRPQPALRAAASRAALPGLHGPEGGPAVSAPVIGGPTRGRSEGASPKRRRLTPEKEATLPGLDALDPRIADMLKDQPSVVQFLTKHPAVFKNLSADGISFLTRNLRNSSVSKQVEDEEEELAGAGRTLMVTNLGLSITEAEVEELLEVNFLGPAQVTIPRESRRNQSCGVAYAVLLTAAKARFALRVLKGATLRGCPVQVELFDTGHRATSDELSDEDPEDDDADEAPEATCLEAYEKRSRRRVLWKSDRELWDVALFDRDESVVQFVTKLKCDVVEAALARVSGDSAEFQAAAKSERAEERKLVRDALAQQTEEVMAIRACTGG